MDRLVDTPLWGAIATAEQYTGWLALSFAYTMAFGNAATTLWKIAEYGTARATWAALFFVMGLTLVLAPRWHIRRAHFVLAMVAAMLWAYFGTQAWNVNAVGAAMIAGIATVYMGLTAKQLYRRE